MIKKYKLYFTNKQFLLSASAGILFLLISLVVNLYAGLYATEQASNAVTDIVLSNTRVYDIDGLFIYGSIVFWFFVALLMALEPKRIPFILKSVALFVLIRSVFISLTHLGPFPTHIPIDPSSVINYFSFGADFFFSGHTGLPFLMALLFWDDPRLRVLFIFSAIAFGIVVLLGHLHYSIDVLSAFFITYAIFHIAETVFKKDREIFFAGLEK